MAEAITTYGQLAIQYGGHKINEFLNGVLGANGDWIITQDTDSAYIDMSGVVEKMFGKDPDQTKVINFLDRLFKDKMEGLFEQWFNELCDKLNCYENKFVFKREVIAPVGIWTAKKRYAALVMDSEGVRYEKPKMKYIGLEAKKSSTPKHCRKWLVECYGLAMTEDESVLHARVAEIKKEFMSKPIEDIAAPRSVNNLEKYQDAGSIYVKGTPKHVKAALFHNFLVENLPEAKGVGLINSGDKIKFVELKRNKYGFEVMGFQGFLPREFDMERYVDKQATFQKTFLDPLQVFLNAVGWNYEPKASVMDFFV